MRPTERVGDAFILPGHAFYAADPLATISTPTNTLHVMGALESRNEKVPCSEVRLLDPPKKSTNGVHKVYNLVFVSGNLFERVSKDKWERQRGRIAQESENSRLDEIFCWTPCLNETLSQFQSFRIPRFFFFKPRAEGTAAAKDVTVRGRAERQWGQERTEKEDEGDGEEGREGYEGWAGRHNKMKEKV